MLPKTVAGNEKLRASFSELGIDAEAFVNMSLEEKLMALSAGFENVEGNGNKLRLALEVLGKSGAELLPFLLQGPEAIRESMESAVVATQAQIDKMAELNDRIEVIGQNVRTSLGGAFVWVVQQLENFAATMEAAGAVGMERIQRLAFALSKLSNGDFGGAASEAKKLVTSLPEDFQRIRQMAADAIAERDVSTVTIAEKKSPFDFAEEEEKIDAEEAEKKKVTSGFDADAKKAEVDRQAKEQTLLSLRQKLADQEFDKLTRSEKILTLLNEANNLAADRGENEEDRLRRQIRLNEVGVELSRLRADRERDEQGAVRESFRRREASLGFASGMQAAGADSGLLGVNYRVGAVEAQKQVELQREMVAFLQEIAKKEYTVSLPEATN